MSKSLEVNILRSRCGAVISVPVSTPAPAPLTRNTPHTNTRADLIDKGGCKRAIFCSPCHLKGQADLLLQQHMAAGHLSTPVAACLHSTSRGGTEGRRCPRGGNSGWNVCVFGPIHPFAFCWERRRWLEKTGARARLSFMTFV